MIYIKESVRIHGIRPEIVLTVVIAADVYRELGQNLVITSVIDGEHMRASIHYTGGAIDFGVPDGMGETIRQRLHTALGADYDVVLEGTHIHVEWQPKEPYV